MPTVGPLLFGKFWMHVTSEAVLKYVSPFVPTKIRTHIIQRGSAGACLVTMSQSHP
uniref:Uncharacterized protein n=1 Tax=Arundo donax TaxID=35708 RepID=A0A0A9DUF4_ARUDO